MPPIALLAFLEHGTSLNVMGNRAPTVQQDDGRPSDPPRSGNPQLGGAEACAAIVIWLLLASGVCFGFLSIFRISLLIRCLVAAGLSLLVLIVFVLSSRDGIMKRKELYQTGIACQAKTYFVGREVHRAGIDSNDHHWEEAAWVVKWRYQVDRDTYEGGTLLNCMLEAEVDQDIWIVYNSSKPEHHVRWDSFKSTCFLDSSIKYSKLCGADPRSYLKISFVNILDT